MEECCRGDIVIKVGNIQVESKTKHSTTSTPSPSSPTIKTTSNPPSSSTKDQVNLLNGVECPIRADRGH